VPIRVLKMRDGSAIGDPNRRSFALKVRTTDAPSGNQVVVPFPGSPGDPTLAGMQITVYNASGSGEKTVISLPAGPSWAVLGSTTQPRGYRYKGLAGDPVRKVIVKDDLLKVRAKGAGFGYSLNEPSQGSIAVRLASGGGVTWCGRATPSLDVQDAFTGVKDAPAPATCPPVP
jgi:hypothetical protein